MADDKVLTDDTRDLNPIDREYIVSIFIKDNFLIDDSEKVNKGISAREFRERLEQYCNIYGYIVPSVNVIEVTLEHLNIKHVKSRQGYTEKTVNPISRYVGLMGKKEVNK